jgi:AcrR family transcriptional regulator
MTELASRRPGRPRDEAIDMAILDATVDELIERGYSGLSIEAIAARAGVAKTTVYRRWPNTDGLVFEAMRAFDPKADAKEPALQPGREELLFLLDRMRRTWNDPRYASLMRRATAEGISRPEMYAHFRDRLLKSRLARMQVALERAVTAGAIRPDADLSLVRQLLTAPVLAGVLTHRDRLTRAQLEFGVDTILRGLAP